MNLVVIEMPRRHLPLDGAERIANSLLQCLLSTMPFIWVLMSTSSLRCLLRNDGSDAMADVNFSSLDVRCALGSDAQTYDTSTSFLAMSSFDAFCAWMPELLMSTSLASMSSLDAMLFDE